MKTISIEYLPLFRIKINLNGLWFILKKTMLCFVKEIVSLYVLARKTPEILPRMPKRMRNAQQNLPAVRFAQRVMAITPLFYILY